MWLIAPLTVCAIKVNVGSCSANGRTYRINGLLNEMIGEESIRINVTGIY